MPKVYDPILCMMVDKSATMTTDAKGGKLAKKVNDASYPAEVYKMQNEVARVKKIDKNHISIRKLSNDKYEFSNRLGDPLAVYNDKAGTLMMYDSKSAHDSAKVQDVAPATQRYINTIVGESKSNAEKFVRQAEQDDEVPENELKYVYKAYNDKFGYKFHDSASALEKAIRAIDASLPEWLVTAESDLGEHVEYTTRKATAAEAKAEAEKMGFNNVQVRKY